MQLNSQKIVETTTLTTSLGGLDIPLLTITNFKNKQVQVETNKKVIVITGRVHPGESNASYLMHGFLQFILSSDKSANELRNKYIFKIIPMINPDGVAIGNNRTSFLGRDLNRTY